MKALSKSKFKQGLECPNKLFFSNSPGVYHNIKKEDPFLSALASGGFQIEEYARLKFPNGVLIDTPYEGNDYQGLANQTAELLNQDNVTIYEAAFYIDNLFIRTDILVKQGNQIQLIEVKAKSIDPSEEYNFVGKNGGLVSSWKPYLFDLAFQTHVAQRCLPRFKITPYLCLVDKTKNASVEGLNQLFRIKQGSEKRTGVEVLVNDASELGDNLLHLENLTEVVSKIHDGSFRYYDNLNFHEAVILLSDIRIKDYYPNWPTQFAACKKCEFKKDENGEENTKLSGFDHCFRSQHHWTDEDLVKPNIFNIWNLKDAKLLEQGLLFKEQLKPEDINYKEEVGCLSSKERQWLQIEKERDGDFSEYVDVEGLRAEMNTWVFPLHFIDFETSTVALPFHVGRKPYEQIAFQFSHHICYEDGRVEHANEYINTTHGEFPNFEFAEQLRLALSQDQGSVFRYSTHENTILNAILDQLESSKHELKDDIGAFIKSICQPKGNHPNPWSTPVRNMIDLCEVVKKYYYNPYTFGSNSIKHVLPAVLQSSKAVQEKYANPIGKIQLTSKNFPESHVWLTRNQDGIVSPYKMLPSVFDNLSQEDIDATLSDIENINDGGAALTAYGKIQYTDMTTAERLDIADALKRYCELDTLAMVMIYEHLKSLT